MVFTYTWSLPKKEKGLIKDKNHLTNTKIHTTILLWYYFTQNCEATINAIVANSSETSDSWCLYQRDKSNGTNVYKRKHCQSMYDMPFYQFITTLRNMKYYSNVCMECQWVLYLPNSNM